MALNDEEFDMEVVARSLADELINDPGHISADEHEIIYSGYFLQFDVETLVSEIDRLFA